MMLCMPRIAACGGLTIGVDIIEPKVPPLAQERISIDELHQYLAERLKGA